MFTTVPHFLYILFCLITIVFTLHLISALSIHIYLSLLILSSLQMSPLKKSLFLLQCLDFYHFLFIFIQFPSLCLPFILTCYISFYKSTYSINHGCLNFLIVLKSISILKSASDACFDSLGVFFSCL